ncbi:hypothetical protein VTN02DRAFT_1263 [Thermoascus thermophilus]
MKVWKIVPVFTTWISTIQAASRDEWKSRHCSIWISPITYPIQEVTSDLSAYHGYWQQDLYSINPRFGTRDDLERLSHELHSRGMYLMVDVVVNNLAWAGNGNTVDYSKLKPFDNGGYYHPFRLLSDDPLNQTCVKQCWLGDTVVSLPDLRTEDSRVSSMLYTWVKQLVSNYSIDGLRLDSIFNVNEDFWSGFNRAAGVFCLGEGITDNATTLCPLQNNMDGVLNYPMYYCLTAAFNSTTGSMHNLVRGMRAVKNKCKDVFALGIFTENQDVPRFASYTGDLSLAGNIIAYNILGDGIPVLYYGQEQHFSGSSNPLNREALWPTGYRNNTTPLPSLIQSLNHLRAHAASNGARFTNRSEPFRDYLTYITLPIHESAHVLALRKGFKGNQIITVLSNLGSHPDGNAETTVLLSAEGTDFTPGQNLTEILSCRTVLADQQSGNLTVSLADNGGPRVFYPTESLEMSGLCGHKLDGKPPKSTRTKLVTATPKATGGAAAAAAAPVTVIGGTGVWFLILSLGLGSGLAVLFVSEALF